MIKFLVDTSSDYTLEEAAGREMALIPIRVSVGEKEYRDVYDLGKDFFYELLTMSEDFPKTSQPSPADFMEVFEEAKEKNEELICILLSSQLSGTYQSAVLAKDLVDYDKIYLIDSLSVTHGIRLLAEYGQELARQNKSAEEIVAELEQIKGNIKLYATLDTLEYLYKGGRLNKTTAMLGEMAKVKPSITIADGKVAVIGKSIGKSRAISAVIKAFEKCKLDERFPIYSIFTYGIEKSELFEERLKELGVEVKERLQVGATIGTHIGPGAFGMVFVSK